MFNVCCSYKFQSPLVSLFVCLLLVLGVPFVLENLGLAILSVVIHWRLTGIVVRYGGGEVFYNLLIKSQAFGGPVSWKFGLHRCFYLSHRILLPYIPFLLSG